MVDNMIGTGRYTMMAVPYLQIICGRLWQCCAEPWRVIEGTTIRSRGIRGTALAIEHWIVREKPLYSCVSSTESTC